MELLWEPGISFADTTIDSNIATTDGDGGSSGGGIASEDSSLTLDHCNVLKIGPTYSLLSALCFDLISLGFARWIKSATLGTSYVGPGSAQL